MKPTGIVIAVLGVLTTGLAASCRKGPEITCRVNEVCFVCPDAKERASCLRDPASSRCKWAEPGHCK